MQVFIVIRGRIVWLQGHPLRIQRIVEQICCKQNWMIWYGATQPLRKTILKTAHVLQAIFPIHMSLVVLRARESHAYKSWLCPVLHEKLFPFRSSISCFTLISSNSLDYFLLVRHCICQMELHRRLQAQYIVEALNHSKTFECSKAGCHKTVQAYW